MDTITPTTAERTTEERGIGTGARLVLASQHLLRTQGKERVRQRLEHLIDTGMIGSAGADKVYRDVFGDHLPMGNG
jgi:hypothetical protein